MSSPDAADDDQPRAGDRDTATNAVSLTRRRLMAIVLGSLLALAGTEVALRVSHAVRGTYELDDTALAARRSSLWMRSDDPELAYVHRPSHRGSETASTEANGLLAPSDVETTKAPGTRRVAVVGDSIGAGLEYAYEQRFPARLEHMLRDVGEPVEVLNFCVSGYSTLQEARLIETRMAHFDVDLVILQYCMNDPVVTYTPMTWFVDPEPPVCFAWNAVRRGARRVAGLPNELPYVPKNVFETPEFWQQHYSPESESWASVRTGFDRVAAWSAAEGVPVLVAVVPLFVPQDPRGETSRAFREQAAAAARASGLTCIDLQPAFAGVPFGGMQMTPGDPYHPSSAGHEVIARALVSPTLDILADRR